MNRLIVSLVIAALSAPAASADVTARTTILFSQAPCPGETVCNAFHVRWVKHNGAVLFEKSFPSTSQAANFAIDIPTTKGTISIWSDR